MAPELFQGAEAGPVTDVYALGVSYFLMLTGRCPYNGNTLNKLMTCLVDEPRERSIRSFVMRAGRMTVGQARALEDLWPRYGVEYAPQPLDLELFGLQLPLAGKGTLRIGRKSIRPFAQHVLMHAQIPRGLGKANPALLDQLYRFNLELSCKLPSFHDPPPVP